MVDRIECLDVGQGTCNVIQLPGNRCIVVDVGPKVGWQVLAKKLNLDPDAKGPPVVIEALILSHSHEDHFGALSPLLQANGVKINQIFLTHDRESPKECPVLRVLNDAVEQGLITRGQLTTRELDETGKPIVLFRSQELADGPNGAVTLSLLYPTKQEAKVAREKDDQNLGSAILCLRVGEHRFLFPGDASLVAFEAIAQRMPRPLELELIAVSHHGGNLWNGRFTEALSNRLKGVFNNHFKPRHAVISVGTSNTHGHPRQYIIDALKSAGTYIMCTQLTCKCWKNNPDLESARSFTLSAQPPEFPGMGSKSEFRKNGRSSRVGCASTVVVRFEDQKPVIERRNEHSQVIDRIRKEGSALC
ncbi:MAG: MBL fold metallo-hydrolase [Planctomycetota bacterium]|nr:MBL fold metallo-hydrolase [Planctomycetota bacterium]MDA0921070.1 MBL fold metallo-hydrolase [Planctomycetota bacterium]MDA1160540.1 MBL fold metallo-hydrolase [Planctomycetota bacterium]